MRNVLKLAAALAAILFGAGRTAPSFRYLHDTELSAELAAYTPVYPGVKFAVISDDHLYDSRLGTNGWAFTDYLHHDRKMLALSEEILDTALPKIIAEKPDFLLVCGDLTKDGERQDDELLASKLAKVKAAGIKVFVIPGNHDIWNTRAVRFEGSNTIRVSNVSPTDFTNIYTPYGYGQAIARDPGSLSYVAEPVPGLWLLCLDSTIHVSNRSIPETVTAGGFEQPTVDWIEGILARAVKEHKAVIAAEHHGVNPHWEGQQKLHSEYLLNHYEDFSKMFAAYKVRVVFTGHYHSHDVSFRKWGDGQFVYDVETGSFVTYPSPWRIVTVDGGSQTLNIDSRFVTSIPSMPDGFVTYASNFTYNGVWGIAVDTIMGYHVPRNQAEKIADEVSSAFLAHYAGDENPGSRQIIDKRGLGLMGRLVINNQAYVIRGLWHDSPAPDVKLSIDLRTGEWH